MVQRSHSCGSSGESASVSSVNAASRQTLVKLVPMARANGIRNGGGSILALGKGSTLSQVMDAVFRRRCGGSNGKVLQVNSPSKHTDAEASCSRSPMASSKA